MASLPLLAAIIGVLILINGVFAAMEIALVSVPRARLERFEKEGRRGASTALSIQRNMDRFFAAVQIGVTFVATLSSAIGGAVAVDALSPLTEALGISSSSSLSRAVPILIMTVTISYVSLVVGELVPKSVARRYPGRISLFLSPFFSLFAAVTRPAVRVLTASTMGVLRVLGVPQETKRAPLTTEEFRMMASELVESHQIPMHVYDVLVRVTRLTKIRVEDVMVPRSRMVSIVIRAGLDEDLRREALNVIRSQPFTNYPVFDGDSENVLGILNLKDFIRHQESPNVGRWLRNVYYTVRGQPLSEVLAVMQKKRCHLLMVVDEHGVVDGAITLDDILDELVGEIDTDGSRGYGERLRSYSTLGMTVDGQMTLFELEEFHSISLPRSQHYSTLAGFILDRMGKIPEEGDATEYEGRRFEVAVMHGNRVERVRILPSRDQG
jgi:putative hemolysin